MPHTRVDTTGNPVAIASTSTFGMPSRSPSSSTRQASAKAVERRYSREQLRLTHRTRQRHPVPQPQQAHELADPVRGLALLPDQLQPHVDAAVGQQRDGAEQHVETLLGHQPPDAEETERPRCRGPAPPPPGADASSSVMSALRPW